MESVLFKVVPMPFLSKKKELTFERYELFLHKNSMLGIKRCTMEEFKVLVKQYCKEHNLSEAVAEVMMKAFEAGALKQEDLSNPSLLGWLDLYQVGITNDVPSLQLQLNRLARFFAEAHEVYKNVLQSGGYHRSYLFLQGYVIQATINLYSLNHLLSGTPVLEYHGNDYICYDDASIISIARITLERFANLDYFFLNPFASDRTKRIRFNIEHIFEVLDRHTSFMPTTEETRRRALDELNNAKLEVKELIDLGYDLHLNKDIESMSKNAIKAKFRKCTIAEKIELMGIGQIEGFNSYSYYSRHVHASILGVDEFIAYFRSNDRPPFVPLLGTLIGAATHCMIRLISHFPQVSAELSALIDSELSVLLQFHLKWSEHWLSCKPEQRIKILQQDLKYPAK